MKRIDLTQDNLHRIIWLHRQLQRDKEQLYMLREMAEGTASIPTDTVHVQNSLPPSGNKFAVAAADLTEMMEAEEYELKELQDKVKSFVETIEDPVDSRVIQLRYIECYEWQMISNLVGYTRRHVFRIHNKMVAELPKE